jgi:hypothetical protein
MYLILDIVDGMIYSYEMAGENFETALKNTLYIYPDYFGLGYLKLNKEENINVHLDKIKEMVIYEINFGSKKVTRFHL